MGAMEGLSYNDTVERLKTLYWPTLKANWMLWPAVMVGFLLDKPGQHLAQVLITASSPGIAPFLSAVPIELWDR